MRFIATKDWANCIPVTAGDIVEVTGVYLAEMYEVSIVGSDDDETYMIDVDTQKRAEYGWKFDDRWSDM